MDHHFPRTFHPLIEPWFLRTYGPPTAVQAEAWPRIARGENVLALAPTGSGKTLAAFLDALSRFALGEYDAGKLSVLYVSPLKALNEDIRINLQDPLESLKSWFEREDQTFPNIRAETRSGDTPASERRRFLTRPPSILATTPESLAILLANPRARSVLSGVRLLILDEIHSVMDSKRGSFLASQVGILSLLAGEFRRVALSATVRPASTAAEFVGGYRRIPDEGGPGFLYEKRPVVVVDPPSEKTLELTVEFPREPTGLAPPGTETGEPRSARYGSLIGALSERTRRNRSTLVFTDSRRRAERIAFLLNEAAGVGTAYAHHGSLSKDVRRLVEERLRLGELPCVVATGSLELGIDIGSVDEVVLAGAPQAVAPALQRIGRSGHGVGRTSRGTLFPFHAMDLLRSVALAGAIQDREIEALAPIENPLDILAQTILALCVQGPWNVQELYQTLLEFPPFHTLSRVSYDRVVEMLAGKYETARLRDLKPRIRYDRISGTLSAAEGTLALLYSSGGAIPDRGVYSLRLADGNRIGELDEEFVWERRVGDAFSFGTRSWRITEIGPEAVEVVPLDRPADFVPFWKGESRYRSSIISRRVLELSDAFRRDSAAPGLEIPGISEDARAALGSFLDAQRSVQGGAGLPGPSRVTLELCSDPGLRGEAVTAVLHTLRGGAVNEPLALALSSELEESTGLRIETIADEDFVLLIFPSMPELSPEEAIPAALRRLGDSPVLEGRVRARLESSGVFGAAFREAAGRSLLLPRAGFGKRTPLWITRLRAKRLFDSVKGFGDFPAIAEAWRTCLIDLFDMEQTLLLLGGISRGEIRVEAFRTRAPSPFAREAVWQETNRFLYEGDAEAGRRGASLSDSAIEEALKSSNLRPELSEALVRDFASRLRRELQGWAPEDGPSLSEWVKERVAVPLDEWAALGKNLGTAALESLREDPSLGSRLASVRLSERGLELKMHEENRAALESDPLRLLGPWLRYEGPVAVQRVADLFGVAVSAAREALDALVETGSVSSGVRVKGVDEDGGGYCDTENLELLLRLTRRAARPVVQERPSSDLAPFLAGMQGLFGGNVREPWAPLSGWAAPARLWETDILPARCPEYQSSLLDAAFSEGSCLWFGAGQGIVGLCPPGDLDLALPDRDGKSLLVPEGFRDFWALRDASGLSTEECARALWQEARRGLISSDSWASIRAGIAGGFGRPGPRPARDSRIESRPPFGTPRRLPRVLRDRWKAGPPVPGSWFSLEADEPLDKLDEADLDRERVRVLAKRWGILCRPLLERELPALGWGRLMPAMRRMELSGELFAGRFFSGLGGLQFMIPAGIEYFKTFRASEGAYWMNACDPASLAGVSVEGLPYALPPRVASTRLCYRGTRLVASALRNGREVRIEANPGEADLPEILAFLKIPRTRSVLPDRKVSVDTINGEPAARGPYAPVLKSLGFEADRGRMVLW